MSQSVLAKTGLPALVAALALLMLPAKPAEADPANDGAYVPAIPSASDTGEYQLVRRPYRGYYWGGYPYRSYYWGTTPYRSYYWGGYPYRSYYWGTTPYRSYYWGGYPYSSYYYPGWGYTW